MPIAGNPVPADDAVTAGQEPSLTGGAAPPPDGVAAREEQRQRLARLFRKYGDDAASHLLWIAVQEYRFGPQKK